MALKLWADPDWSRQISETLHVGRVDDDQGAGPEKPWFVSLTQSPNRLQEMGGARGTPPGTTLLLSHDDVVALLPYLWDMAQEWHLDEQLRRRAAAKTRRDAHRQEAPTEDEDERHGVMRHQNRGLRKLCGCARRTWAKCPHSWYINFKPRGGKAYQFSLDVEMGKHIAKKEDAQTEADRIRGEIRVGTFVRAAERRTMAAACGADHGGRADARSVRGEVSRRTKCSPRGKTTWTNDKHMLAQLAAFTRRDGIALGSVALGTITEDDLERSTQAFEPRGARSRRSISMCRC